MAVLHNSVRICSGQRTSREGDKKKKISLIFVKWIVLRGGIQLRLEQVGGLGETADLSASFPNSPHCLQKMIGFGESKEA